MLENEINEVVRTAVVKTIKDNMGEFLRRQLFDSWNSSLGKLVNDLEKLVNEAVSKNEAIPQLVNDALTEAAMEPEFKVELRTALRKRLVGELVKSFSLEGTLKELRSKPETRERIINILEEIAQSVPVKP